MKHANTISFNALPLIVLVCFIIAASSGKIKAQCASTMQSSSYDIYLNGSGNNSWGFSIPKFDPSKGTLVAVKISSVVSVIINFQLSNQGSVQDNYNVLAARFDSISSAALITPLTNNVSQNFGPYTLQPAQDTVGAGTVASPQFFSLMNAYSINDSFTSSVAGFLGSGYISFAYTPNTHVSVTSGSNYGISTIISDTMRLTFTYYYCAQNLLALDITNFMVNKLPVNLAKISWNTQNETEGKIYDVQESPDGKMFQDIASVPSLINKDNISSYNDDYVIPAGISGKLYFRLKEISASGNISYSEIKDIEVDDKADMYIYPNPANSFINLVINQQGVGSWQADIFASDGQLVQRNYAEKCNNMKIIFNHALPKGTYFLRLTNQEDFTKKTLSFVVL